MPKIRTPPIATTVAPDTPPSVTSLQRNVVGALSKLTTQINASSFTDEPAPANLNMGGFKVQNIATPTQDGDAVNLGYLKRGFKGAAQPPSNGAGDAYYEIVFFNPGDIAVGTAAQYNVGAGREGTPIEANISALTPPTGASITANFVVNGTATVMSTAITLPAGTSTVVASTALTGGISFNHNDMVVLVVTGVGATLAGANVCIGLVVKRS